ncbi:MAG TPA: hypothetical protein VJY62_19975, partial [Bacteroidia bacterium]|nr:hypothetical protein [Bacteroidia bacterium]
MKRKFAWTALAAVIYLNTHAQISLEHVYPNSGYFKVELTPGYPSGNAFGCNYLYLVNLEIDGEKYVDIDKVSRHLYFYNLNHTLFKTIDYSNVYNSIGEYPYEDEIGSSVMYISQQLFDPDPAIEFLYTFNRYYYNTTSNRAITQIVKENGSILFSDSAAPLVKFNFHNQYYPIYNTVNGTKMILSNIDGTAEVFSLPGTFSTSIASNNIMGENAEMNLFPNPAINHGILTINYKLPDNIKTAVLIVTDAQGKQLN